MELQQKSRYTSEEYFELEAQSTTRHEYWDGEIVAMSGTTKPHNIIVLNMVMLFRNAMKGKGCGIYAENIRTEVAEHKKYTYPDIVISCDERDKKDKLSIKYPIVLVKVLSKGTIDYDKGGKLLHYLRIPTLKHYLLVWQNTCLIQHYQRQENNTWKFQFYDNLHQLIELADLQAILALEGIYEEVGFNEEEL